MEELLVMAHLAELDAIARQAHLLKSVGPSATSGAVEPTNRISRLRRFVTLRA